MYNIYKVSQTCTREEQIELNKKVPYCFSIKIITNELLVNKYPQDHARSHNSARRDGPAVTDAMRAAKNWEEEPYK